MWNPLLDLVYDSETKKLVWEVTLKTPEDGYRNTLHTVIVCVILHLLLTTLLWPITLTICTNCKYSIRTINKLSIKTISSAFDFIAVAGGIKELFYTEASLLSDPVYGYSTHSEFHFSVASGYFFWATCVTIIFGDRTVAPILHHMSCTVMYWMALRPFCHHVGNLFLLFQASTLVLDLHSIGVIIGIIGAPVSCTNRALRIMHPIIFFLVRIVIGIPLSLNFYLDMVRLLWFKIGHSNTVILLTVIGCVTINFLNLFWFSKTLLAGEKKKSMESCSVPVGGDQRIEKYPCRKTCDCLRTSQTKPPITYSMDDINKQPEISKRKTPSYSLQCCRIILIMASIAIPILVISNVINGELEIEKYEGVLNHSDFKRQKSREMVERARRFADKLISSNKNQTLPLIKKLNSNVVDIVISGGGFRGQYAGGVISILKHLEKEGILTIDRWAGTSIGACTAAVFAIDADFETFFRVQYAWQNVWTMREFWKGGPVVREMMRQFFKHMENPHEKLNGTLFVSLTTFDGLRPINELVSAYETKVDFFDALSAGAAIPFFTAEPVVSRYKGRIAIDGGFTLNTPIFTDGKNPQILINLGHLKHPMRYTFSPLDPNHDKLVSKGMDDIVAFLEGNKVKSLKLIPAIHGVSKSVSTEYQNAYVKSEYDHLVQGLTDLYKDLLHALTYDIVPWSIQCKWGLVAAVVFVYSLGVYDEL